MVVLSPVFLVTLLHPKVRKKPWDINSSVCMGLTVLALTAALVGHAIWTADTWQSILKGFAILICACMIFGVSMLTLYGLIHGVGWIVTWFTDRPIEQYD